MAPPTPTNEETTPLIPTDHSRNVQTTSQPRPQITPVIFHDFLFSFHFLFCEYHCNCG